ncbi:structural protein [Lachnospiraceae bacterium]|nr:structural protein [Lachnospiraceae bacterium]
MNITDSVLISIKKLLGIAEEYEHFDADLIMHINSVFSILTQLGVGPFKGFMIEDKSATWKDFTSDESKYMLVKSYMHLKVKLLFDPPLSSAVLECYKTQISEYEWRLNVAAENDNTDSNEPEHYSGSYDVTPKAHQTQTLDTSGKALSEDLAIHEVPYYQTSNAIGCVTIYIAKEGGSK